MSAIGNNKRTYVVDKDGDVNLLTVEDGMPRRRWVGDSGDVLCLASHPCRFRPATFEEIVVAKLRGLV